MAPAWHGHGAPVCGVHSVAASDVRAAASHAQGEQQAWEWAACRDLPAVFGAC